MRQGFQKYSDMRQAYFLNSICEMAINKGQIHATLVFLKIDRRHGDPPVKGPTIRDKQCHESTNGCKVSQAETMCLYDL